MPLAGGIEQMGFQCGQVWGAALAAGAQAYQLFGSGPQAEAAAAHRSAAAHSILPHQLQEHQLPRSHRSGLEEREAKQVLKFLLRGGPIRCFSMTAGFARAAFSEINAAFADDPLEAPAPPVSCAAIVARKMGASDLHTVMAAGLAGGIGLSGGACGALGAAIWLIEMNRVKEGTGKVEFNSPEATEAIDRFLQMQRR